MLRWNAEFQFGLLKFINEIAEQPDDETGIVRQTEGRTDAQIDRQRKEQINKSNISNIEKSNKFLSSDIRKSGKTNWIIALTNNKIYTDPRHQGLLDSTNIARTDQVEQTLFFMQHYI